MGQVLVLNVTYEKLQWVDVKHAVKMVMREVAEVYETTGEIMRSANGSILVPKVIRLIRYVKDAWKYTKDIRYSKQGVLRRDNKRCAYCGAEATTIDHVHPVSLGGMSTWENSVASCRRCNLLKADKTLKQLGWELSFIPKKPSRSDLVGVYVKAE